MGALNLEHVEYPDGDGQPMGESDLHMGAMAEAVFTLREWFAGAEVYVAGNNFLYFVEGNPKKCVSPDCYMVRGVPQLPLRKSFKTWEERDRTPSFVLEVTSHSTRRNDAGSKLALYRDVLEVREYFQFDPEGDWIPEVLRGLVLRKGQYGPAAVGPTGRLTSAELGLELAVVNGELRFFQPGEGAPLPIRRELRDRAADSDARAAEATAQAAEATAQAAEATAKAAEATAKAAESDSRAAAAEAEVTRLRAELDRLAGG
ncbi:Uma2 family endonuclease [Planctomycetota bacterium]|nr:Uma2 family endonuclease [Planctomycetota bacterium]